MKARVLKLRIDAGLEERLKKAAGPRGVSRFVERAIERELREGGGVSQVAHNHPQAGATPALASNRKPRPEDFDSRLKYEVAENAWNRRL